MNPKKNFPENQSNDSAFGSSSAVDDFIRELEEKERALHISPDLVLEFEDSDISHIETEDLSNFRNEFEEKSIPINTGKLPKLEILESKEIIQTDNNEAAQLREQLSQIENERKELKESLRLQKTDFDNYRTRTERERNNIFRNILSDMGTQLLPVIDNLGRALNLNFPSEKSDELQHFIDGISLVNQQLYDVLERMGIQPIKSVGRPFDPHFHEAVAAEETNEFPPHTVIAEILRGFQLDDKVIRHSLVKVSSTLTNSELPLKKSSDE